MWLVVCSLVVSSIIINFVYYYILILLSIDNRTVVYCDYSCYFLVANGPLTKRLWP